MILHKLFLVQLGALLDSNLVPHLRHSCIVGKSGSWLYHAFKSMLSASHSSCSFWLCLFIFPWAFIPFILLKYTITGACCAATGHCRSCFPHSHVATKRVVLKERTGILQRWLFLPPACSVRITDHRCWELVKCVLLSCCFLLEHSVLVPSLCPKLVLFHLHSGVSSAGQDRSTYEPIDQPDAPPQWPSSSKTAQPPYWGTLHPGQTLPSPSQAFPSSHGAAPATGQTGEDLIFLLPT